MKALVQREIETAPISYHRYHLQDHNNRYSDIRLGRGSTVRAERFPRKHAYVAPSGDLRKYQTRRKQTRLCPVLV